MTQKILASAAKRGHLAILHAPCTHAPRTMDRISLTFAKTREVRDHCQCLAAQRAALAFLTFETDRTPSGRSSCYVEKS